jgi:hypothetical protein
MFLLANKYSFEQDTEACSLSAHCGYSEDFSWTLQLASQSVLTRLQHKSARASFSISVRPPLGKVHWQDLPGSSFEIPAGAGRNLFQFQFNMYAEWEELTDLHLRFGQTRDTQIEVFAEGHGCVEAWPDFFPKGWFTSRFRHGCRFVAWE